MSISKAHWNTDGDNVRLSMPLTKVDKERRTVTGFASLDNIDKQDDIVTAEASLDAFKRFRGNIREMHQPSAVGKMLSFKQDKYYDPETKKFYNGVLVSAYVSKGAQDAWEKVLDGTYTGFSIGGRMNKWDDAYDEKSDKTIRVIKEYDLIELSLVDSPANQFASIVSVEKVDGVDVVKGDAVNTQIENVFWDKQSGIVMVSENENEVSPITGQSMQNIGFVEKTDNEKTQMVKFLVDSAKGISTSKMTKEEDPMAKTSKAVNELVTKSDEIVEEAQIAPEAVEKAETVDTNSISEKAMKKPAKDEEESAADAASETQADEDAEAAAQKKPAKKSDEVTVEEVTVIKDDLTTAFSDLVAIVKTLQTEVEMLKSSKVDVEVAKDSFEAVAKDIATAREEFDKFGKRVDAVEADTAFRKSGDLGEIIQEQPVMVEKSLWGGSFLKTADLFR